ncbi:glycosyltransferase family 4 protein [Leptospira sp. 201903070]|uniref:Glycosyltransferase family 4 protein n=1 Tax=Leptospira ainlahdjerensis TaxID=2810033 RepID=A0ABS2UCP0_9LEPT|nr:glycosyltransferase family 1 protein [Leptospira ainlahdjerensis]MBM9576695.1 glycosyltransferase family 4 protein [Leptospira ainlahdjerensis]
MNAENFRIKRNYPVKIGLDARMIAHSGIGMRIRGILKYIGPLAADENFQIYLFGNKETIEKEGILCREFIGFEEEYERSKLPALRGKKNPPYSYPVISYEVGIYSLREFFGHPLMKKMDFLDIPHFNAPLRYLSKSIVTIHDIIPFRMKEFHSSFAKRIYLQVVFRWIRAFSKKVVSVSRYTAQDLETVFHFSKDEIQVIPNGIDETVFYPASSQEKKRFLKKYGLEEGYLLSVGIGKGHKNLNFVLNVLKSFWDSKLLKRSWVLGGASGKVPDYLEQDVQGYENRILPMKRLSLEELRCLYSSAGVLIFPSKYEGFGFPPIEAQACGCPVFSSDATVMPEILEDSVLYFSPDRPEELEILLNRFLKNPKEIKTLIGKGKKNSEKFSWKIAAKKTLENYKIVY